MKLGSLFDGSGGFPLAGAIHGITPVWASEIEPYPIRVTKARFPQMKHLGSVLDVNGAEVEPVDIITFGSPCQDLSVAGKQAGLHKGERSNLFFEAIRIIKEMRRATNGTYPRIAVWENVPGAYSSNKGEDFRAVLQAFCSIKDEAADVPRPASGKWNPAGDIVGNGWSIAWRTFDAQFWGVPQRRKRIYLIADFGSERAGEILFEQEGVRGDFAESGKAGESATDNAEGSIGRGGQCLTPWDVQSKRIYREDSKWPGLCTGKRICDGSVLIFAADAERGAGGGCELVGFQSSQSGFRLCATHATLDANNGSRRQNGVCYPAPGGAEGGIGRSGVRCLNPSMPQSSRIYSTDGVYPCLSSNESGGLNRQAVCFQQNQRDEVRDMGDKAGSIAANSGAHQTNYLCINANDQVENINGREVKANLSSTWGEGQPVCYAVQACGDRDNPSVSVSDTAYCLPANPMSDRGQSVCYPIDSHQQDSRFKVCADGISPTLPGQMGTGGNNGPMVMTFQNTGRGWWNEGKIAQTLRTPCGGDSTKANLVLKVEPAKPPRKYIIRRLTPLECARLQGFPDWWETGVQGSDSARYKMWGNGIALPNAEYVIGCAKKLIGATQ